ncbi:MAG: hypothetical protein HYX49_02465 [Chloroflexi bacterium]|nr:hypothetical protein [Chloroflexota bacterium]
MKRDWASFFNIWTIAGALIVAACLLLFTLISIGWTRSPQNPAVGFVPADLTIIAPPTATAVSQPTATPGGTVTPLPGLITVGAYVQISGTGADGLRIRSAAGLNSDTVFRGEESETFQVKDGPQDADGYTWWYIAAPYDDTRAGWAAADYLAVVPSP